MGYSCRFHLASYGGLNARLVQTSGLKTIPGITRSEFSFGNASYHPYLLPAKDDSGATNLSVNENCPDGSASLHTNEIGKAPLHA